MSYPRTMVVTTPHNAKSHLKAITERHEQGRSAHHTIHEARRLLIRARQVDKALSEGRRFYAWDRLQEMFPHMANRHRRQVYCAFKVHAKERIAANGGTLVVRDGCYVWPSRLSGLLHTYALLSIYGALR